MYLHKCPFTCKSTEKGQPVGRCLNTALPLSASPATSFCRVKSDTLANVASTAASFSASGRCLGGSAKWMVIDVPLTLQII